ncbi:MAG: LPS-assembly protein LptD [Deltaproteobacteria bacterium]|nr:LPS-assembly protein LptD [Deltaproteobacteria bacterium]
MRTACAVPIQFKADYYERDLQTDVVRAHGHAWLRQGPKEVWADELEIDFANKRAIANGNVHMREGEMDLWCRHASYNLAGEDGVSEDATLVSGQMVLTGQTINRLSIQKYEVEDGSYTNCNLSQDRTREAVACTHDWKIHGRRFIVTIEKYAHIYDAIFYARALPVMYSPYLVVPVKSKRQSGLLPPHFSYVENLGSGFTLPYFLALADWHDLTLKPTFYSKTGYHLWGHYRYIYSDEKLGEVSLFLLQRRFSANPDDPETEDTTRNRFLGAIGEAAINARNKYSLGGRAHSRQVLRLVSNPYYTRDYKTDVGLGDDAASLRSQLSVTLPSDNLLLTAEIAHHQSLILSKDSGSDGGAATKLPVISFSKITQPFGQYFAFEADTQFTNYFRPGSGYDPIAATSSLDELKREKKHTDPNSAYHEGDYIRTGRRLQLEPKLIGNIPMPPGFQFQPVLKAGSLAYHFDYPASGFSHREYAETELPVSIYLSKSFGTGIPGFERISHVLQPRFIYSRSLYQGGTDHPFFAIRDNRGLLNPRFDILDQITPFEYMRFELINRFRRKSESTIERFLLVQLSEQYNLRTSADDPRYQRRLGPIELLADLKIWRFTAQVQANFQLETTRNTGTGEDVRENDWSSTIEYRSPSGDSLKFGKQFHIRADDAASVKSGTFGFYKTLPTFFNLEGDLEYSFKTGDPGAYRLALLFAAKPVSCWAFTLSVGRNALKQPFAFFVFTLNFGNFPGSNIL